MTTRKWMIAIGLILFFGAAAVAYAAYSHKGEIDSANFLAAYPGAKGTKLDSCTTCHRGGSYVSQGKTTTLGSCSGATTRLAMGRSPPTSLTHSIRTDRPTSLTAEVRPR